jgi:hypothetical protein
MNIPNKTLLFTSSSGDATTSAGVERHDLDIYMSNSFGNQMLGIHGITASLPGTPSTLFGLSTTSFSVWSGNQFPVGSWRCRSGKLEDGVGLAAARGAEDEDISTFINPINYTNLVVEASSARRYDSSFKQGKLDNGARALEYYGPTGSDPVGVASLRKRRIRLRTATRALQAHRVGGRDLRPPRIRGTGAVRAELDLHRRPGDGVYFPGVLPGSSVALDPVVGDRRQHQLRKKLSIPAPLH